jgi:U3 small nucleolar RNA-associated protein 4
MFCLTQTIPGADGSEVSSLAWARAAEDPSWRLFAATLSGQIQELSISQLQPIASTDSSGGAVWALRAAPCTPSTSSSGGNSPQQQLISTQLAAACADGSVKLFSVSSGEACAVFTRALPRVEGNVLSLAWHPNGRNIVSGGSNGCMHVWDLNTGERHDGC